MNLTLNKQLIEFYKSSSQKIRILTEDWVNKQIYCPGCGYYQLEQYSNNRPVADFFCSQCREDFELKSKKDLFGGKIVDGEYQTMLTRLADINSPHFFFLNYDSLSLRVVNFFVIPRYFFVQNIIERRKPLSSTARRAGWTGCNILLRFIPDAGKIYFVKDYNIALKDGVISKWRRTLFLRESQDSESRSWTLAVMRCIDRLARKEFFLDDVYTFEEELRNIYPNNKHIKDKIRQQLQVLRDKGYLEFIGRGKYRLATLAHDKVVGVQTREVKAPSEEERFIDQLEIEINKKLKFVEYLPVYDLQAMATSFKEQSKPAVVGWKRMDGRRKLNENMFIAQVVGKSMEPTIPDGSFCLFRTERGGSRNGLVVLVESQQVSDPETGLAFTIKRYHSEKEDLGGGQWRHKRIILSPDNKLFQDIILDNVPGDDFRVVAEFVGVV